MPGPVPLPMPDPRQPIDPDDPDVVPRSVRRPRVARIDLPTPDGFVLRDGPDLLVVVDPRVDDGAVGRLMQAAQLLDDLPAPRDGAER